MNLIDNFDDAKLLVTNIEGLKIKEVTKTESTLTYHYRLLKEGNEIVIRIDNQKYIKGIKIDSWVHYWKGSYGYHSTDLLKEYYDKYEEVKKLVELAEKVVINYSKTAEERFLYTTREYKVRWGSGTIAILKECDYPLQGGKE